MFGMRLIIALSIFFTGYFSLGQGYEVKRAKNVFIGDKAIKKGVVFSGTEKIFFEGNGFIELGFKGKEYKTRFYGEIEVDSLFNLLYKADSINAFFNCHAEFDCIERKYGVMACSFKYEIVSITENVEANSDLLKIEWKKPDEITGQMVFYLRIKDFNGLTQDVYSTTEEYYTLNLKKYQNHKFLIYDILTIEPCTTTSEFGIKLTGLNLKQN